MHYFFKSLLRLCHGDLVHFVKISFILHFHFRQQNVILWMNDFHHVEQPFLKLFWYLSPCFSITCCLFPVFFFPPGCSMTDWWSGLIASIISGQERVSILSTEQVIERGGGASEKPAQTQQSLAPYYHSSSFSNSHVEEEKKNMLRCSYWPIESPLKPQFHTTATHFFKEAVCVSGVDGKLITDTATGAAWCWEKMTFFFLRYSTIKEKMTWLYLERIKCWIIGGIL